MKILERIKCFLKREIYLPKLIKRGLQIGENFKMMGGCIIDPAHCWLIRIGNNVTLAPRVHILAHDASTKFFLDYTRISKVNIGNNVFIGAGTIILPGISIGDNVVVGAGSIVTKDLPSNVVAAGNPCKIIMTISEYIEKEQDFMCNINCFDKSFTIPYISEEKKNIMREVLSEYKRSYVK